MQLEHSIELSGLSAKRDLWISKTKPLIEEQLIQQGRRSTSKYRFEVAFEIVEGKRRPATDVDNYAKKTIDAITRTRLLWNDDKQIDVLVIRRRREKNNPSSQMFIRIRRIEGQHSGIPTFFRACCWEVSGRHPFTYAHPGFHLANAIRNQQPNDIDVDSWDGEIKNLFRLLDREDTAGAWNWFCEHFPKCMELVPKRSADQFISGVTQAYREGRMD